jgi:hypothetical protein
VDDLVVPALQERRVDRAEGHQALGRQAGREGHRVLLGDADVERAVREPLLEPVEARAAPHRRVFVYEPALVFPALTWTPVRGSYLPTPCILSLAASAGA